MTALRLLVCTSAAVGLLLSIVSADGPFLAFAPPAVGGTNIGETVFAHDRFGGQRQPSVEDRDLVFIRGLDSSGDCDEAEQWLEEYLDSATGRSFFGSLRIGKYLHFNYRDGGSYDCPRSEPAYGPEDTCDGVVKAASELKDLIDSQASAKVTVVAHSMGGLISAYLVATDSVWASTHIASVVTFDSPLKGVSAPLQWGQLLLTTCTAIGGNPVDSLAEMAEDSAVVRTAAGAATVVPFFALDATQADIVPLDIEFVPRDRASLDGARPFQWANRCDRPSADQGACDPPSPVDDDHSSVWSCRFDQSVGGGCPASGLDKGFLAGCAAAVSLDCKLEGISVSQGATTETSLAVASTATRARFAAHSGGIVRMVLTSPDGTLYGPDGAGPVAGYQADADAEVYEIDNPTPGEWTVELIGVDVAPEGKEVGVALLATGDVIGPDSGTSEQADAGGDGDATPVAGIVAIAAVVGGIIGGAAWYARRRWLS
jgi:pimeloyl-ACP methyl ester carboxylesterase